MGTAIRRRHADAVTRDTTHAMMRRLGQVAMAALVGFHVALLWTHATIGRLGEPAVALRWSVALFVLAAFWLLRRRGVPLLRGRSALILWLLVIVLHAHAAWTHVGVPVPAAVPPTPVVLIPVTAHVALAALLIVAGLAAGASRRRMSDRPGTMPPRFAGLPAAVCVLRFSPRPPPLA
jgi:hypothetical protein